MINTQIIKTIEQDSPFFNSPIHGLSHWKTVERNGLYLAQFSGADKQIISHFAYFHDSMRENENYDPKHGPRGAKYARKLANKLNLTDEQLEKLCFACANHTSGRQTECPTIATCWDADRLDLGRVGITPISMFLFTQEAKRIADQNDYSKLTNFITATNQ